MVKGIASAFGVLAVAAVVLVLVMLGFVLMAMGVAVIRESGPSALAYQESWDWMKVALGLMILWIGLIILLGLASEALSLFGSHCWKKGG